MNLRVGLINAVQFIFGFVVGVAILAGGSAFLGFYLFSKMSGTPARPIFAEELPQEETAATENPSPVQSSASEPAATDNFTSQPEPDLEPGAYKARVTWPRGLILRDSASADAERIGGVGFNWEIVIIEESRDGKWQRVRIPSSGQKGWVKAGNVEKIN